MKNVLMLVIMSAGILTALTGTSVQIQPAFADDGEECEDNDDNNCNKETQNVHQENNCKIVNVNKNDDKSDGNSNSGNGNGDIVCISVAQNPENGDAIVIVDLLPPDLPDPFALVLPH
jgi:hypothetical protein